jgi:hypothetical protein
MKLYVPGLPEKHALGVDLIAKITHEDLTNATANGTQDLTIKAAPAGMAVGRVVSFLKTPFQDLSDSSYTQTTMSVGDAGSATRLAGAIEVNERGTEIIHAINDIDTGHMYTTATDIIVRFTPGSGKDLAALDEGEVFIGLELKETAKMAGF